MASDTLLRLKVDSKEYEDKIRRAQQGMQALEARVRELGGSFEKAEKEDVEFAKALGHMRTVSSGTAGQIGELKKAFIELTAQYNRLTDAEKESPFGKALAGSLSQLKSRIKEGEDELKSIKGELDDTGVSLEELAQKFTGVGIGSLTKFSVATAAAGAALKVMEDAFGQNEIMMDEWGRTVEAAKGVYNGFLNALNTGDISGYLQNIDKIVTAAREAYDALDDLGTFNAFGQINVERANTNFEEAMAAYREGTGTKESVQAAGEVKKRQLQERAKMEADAYEAAVKKLAAERGVSGDMLMDALSGNYGDYDRLKGLPLTGREQRVGTTMYGAPYVQNVTVAANQEEKLGQMLRQLTDDELQGLQALGAQAQRTATEVAQVDKQMARVLAGSAGKASGTGGRTAANAAGTGAAGTAANAAGTGAAGSAGKAAGTAATEPVEGTIRYYQTRISALNKELGDAVTEEVRTEIRKEVEVAQIELKKLQGVVDPGVKTEPGFKMMGTGRYDDLGEEIRVPVHLEMEGLEDFKDDIDLELLPEVLNTDALDKFTEKWNRLQEGMKANAVNALTGAFESLGGAIGGTTGEVISMVAAMAQQVMQGSMTIGSMMAQEAAAKKDATAQLADAAAKTMNAHSWIPWVGVAMGVAMVATMVTTLSSLPKFATGGVVDGNKYSGDQELVRVNSGELILNRAQQGVLASQLQTETGGGGVTAQPYVQAEMIFLGLNNFLRRTGRGEIVTTR